MNMSANWQPVKILKCGCNMRILGEQIPDLGHQNAHQPGMRSQQVALRQRHLDHLQERGTHVQLFPSVMSRTHPRRQVARPHHQQWDTFTCWYPWRALSPQLHLSWLGHVHRMDDDASPGKFCTDNWQQEWGKSGAPPYGSWTLANVTLKLAKLTQTASKVLRVIVLAGDRHWKKESRKQTWSVTRKLKRTSLVAKTDLLYPPPTSAAPCAIGDAPRTLAYTATQDVATPPQDWLGRRFFSLETWRASYDTSWITKFSNMCWDTQLTIKPHAEMSNTNLDQCHIHQQ